MLTESTKNEPNLIISVESRKGGVGKTTAALCLGRILRNKGYYVLVIDLDVTGTNAADIAESPFWKKDLHVIRKSRSINSNPINFLLLFDQFFMIGKPIPRFSINEEGEGILPIDTERVNVLGSQIYQDALQSTDAGAESRNIKLTCLERPGVLFDDIHTLWLMNCIRQLISNFCCVIRGMSPEQTKIAIILDNSPGYVGLSPAIHEWLTDCGPSVGKFLTVTSLDAQDIQACGRAVELLQNIYKEKWNTSRLYLKAKVTGSGINVPQCEESFFLRLATSENLATKCDSLMFYKASEDLSFPINNKGGEVFIDSPSQYIGIILNRVPRAVITRLLVYDLPVARVRGLQSILRGSPKSDTLKRLREYMVSYDEYIENQFILQSLQRERHHSQHRLHQLVQILKQDEQRLGRVVESGPNSVLSILNKSDLNFERSRNQVNRANEIVVHARTAVENAGLGHLARLIHDEWLPGSIFPIFRSALSNFLRESDLPYFEIPPIDPEIKSAPAQLSEFVTRLKTRIIEEHMAAGRNVSGLDDGPIDVFAGLLAYLVGFSQASPFWHSTFETELIELFATVLSVELHHWNSRDKVEARYSIQQFLATEPIRDSAFFKDFFLSTGFRFFRNYNRSSEAMVSFFEFYTACTSAQARLIDFAADAHFLIQLMQFMAHEELERKALFPFVRGIAEDVIINKIVRHEEAPSKMEEALRSAEYYREFDKVLSRVLANWGIAHG